MVNKKVIFATTILFTFANFIAASDSDEEQIGIETTIASGDGTEKTLEVEKTIDSEDDNNVTINIAQEEPAKNLAAPESADTNSHSHQHHCCYAIQQLINKGLAGLGTAQGAVGIACFTGITQGLLNFGWAFNWSKHAGLDPDMSTKIQEICGIVSSVEIIFLGAMFPYMMHKYTQNQEDAT